MDLIALCGFAGSGKDTIADILVKDYGYTKVSFASPLKDAVAAIFHWDRDLLEGSTKESREWREKPDLWWSKRLNIPNLTPRWVLQYIGTDVMRTHFNDNIWIASAEKSLFSVKGKIVVTDARFPNEHILIRDMGGKIGKVFRQSTEPKWFKEYQETGYFPMNAVIHQSETAWLDVKEDFTIHNNGSLEDLKNMLGNLK